MSPGELDTHSSGSDRREEVDMAMRVNGVEPGETDTISVREIDIATDNISFRAIDVALSKHRSLNVAREVHKEFQTKIRHQRSGDYIKFSQGGLLSGVLGSRKDGLLNVQNFLVTRQANPRAEPEYVCCCRIFVEREGFVWFLSYVPNAQSGARIQFQPFDKDDMTSSNIDGRCFVRRELGDDVLFGSYFNEEEPVKPKPEAESPNLDSFEHFSGYTTLHGLRFIGDNTSFVPRRFLWCCLVLLCLTLVSLQVYDRVNYYLSSPKTVNFKVNYNKTLAFPAITICNQNNFRVSSAYKSRWLQFITEMYGNDKNNLHLLPNSFSLHFTVSAANKSKWLKYITEMYGNDNSNRHLLPNSSSDSLDLPISALFVELAHRKEDFIVKCQWENENCSAENFTTTLTRHGVCYTFNRNNAQEDILQVQNAGINHGLMLTLNTEQYESTAGPHDTNGIMMIATDQSDMPPVDEIGLAMSPGLHAFVAISVVTLNDLPPPHGECVKSSSLKSSARYSPETCMLECETRYVVEKCGCRNYYMPDVDGNTRLCTVREYGECLKVALRSFNDVRDVLCPCPTSCYYHIYEPTVSYATSSHMKADLKDSVDENLFKDRYFDAKEITGRTNFDARNTLEASLQKAHDGLNKVDRSMKDLISIYDQDSRLLQNMNDENTDGINKREEMFGLQVFVVERNFLRGRDAMEENVFGMACQGFNEFVSEVGNKINFLISFNGINSTEARVMYNLLRGSIRSRYNTLRLALANYTQLVNAYEKGEPILNFTYKDYGWEEHLAIVPKKLLAEAISKNELKNGTYLEDDDVTNVINAVLNYDNYINSIFGNDSVKYEDEMFTIKRLNEGFVSSCKDFLDKKSIFYSEIIDKPLQTLKTQQNKFSNLKNEYTSLYKTLFNNLESMKFFINDATRIYIPSIREAFTYGLGYFSSGFDATETKRDIAMRFTEKDTLRFTFSQAVYELERKLDDVKRRLDEMPEAWISWRKKINEMWFSILVDEDIKAFSKLKNWVMFQRHASEAKSMKVGHSVKYIMKEFFLRSNGNELKEAIKEIVQEFTGYIEEHDMDEKFYSENFLQVDVFFKELRSEQIDQQVAYDEIALLCDIGGSMGLFIGGSVITFFEILDFIFLFAVHRVLRRRRA